MGITLHWIDIKTLKRRSCALSCTRIQGRHTYDVLAKEINTTLKKYEIEQNVTHCVTDNAANFVILSVFAQRKICLHSMIL